MSLNIMIDLETLDIKPSAVILSIGAVLFDEVSLLDTFYAPVSLNGQHELGRTISSATLLWWVKQSAEAKKVFAELETASDLYDGLDNLTYWYQHQDAETGSIPIWSNGATFDLVILNDAYEGFGLKPPWSYKDERCYRTLRSVYPSIQPDAEPRVEHNALDDARAQALHTQLILAAVNGRR